MSEKTKTFIVELTMDEEHWLIETVEAEKNRIDKSAVGAIGDDREWYWEKIQVAERVEQELEGAFAKPDAHPALTERIKALEEGINEAIMQVLGLHNRPDCWDEANTNKLLDTLQKLESRALLEKP